MMKMTVRMRMHGRKDENDKDDDKEDDEDAQMHGR